MPIFMIERNFAEQLELTAEGVAAVNRVNAEENVRWLLSFLSVDKKKTFCLYESPSAEAVYQAAQKAGIPADAVIELGNEILPNGLMQPVGAEASAQRDG